MKGGLGSQRERSSQKREKCVRHGRRLRIELPVWCRAAGLPRQKLYSKSLGKKKEAMEKGRLP